MSWRGWRAVVEAGRVKIKLAGNVSTLVDIEDSDVAAWNWYVNNGYVRRHGRKDEDQKSVYLHRVILERKVGRPLLPHEQCDHVNGNRLDNRRENIRLATQGQNSANSRLRSDNKTGYKGVTSFRGKFRATIKAKGKYHFLGYFNTPEEAHEAYCKASDILHDEFSHHG